MSNQQKDKYRLMELRKSDFEIADGEPDIRGWKVKNLNGQVIGEVIELLFDPLSQSVRYLLVHIEGKALNIVSRNVLIPIGLADIHEDLDDVLLPKVNVGHLASLPTYNRKLVSSEVERSIRAVFSGETQAAVSAEAVIDTPEERNRFYQDELYDGERMYQKRRNPRVADENIPVVEEQVHTAAGRRFVPRSSNSLNDAPLLDQTITDNNRTGQQAANMEYGQADEQPRPTHFAPFQGGAIEFTEHKEVPVISKDARVVEEISVHKEVDHRDEIIRDSVRHTEVDVEEFDADGKRR